MKKKDKANRRFFNEKRPNPANSRLSENIMKTSWRQLSSLSSRRLDQGEYIHLSLTSSRRLQCVFKTSCQYVFNILQDVFNTSLRHLQDVWSRHLQDLLKTSSRRLAKMSSRHLQDVFKTYSTRSRRTAKKIIYRKICLGHTFDKVMVMVQIFHEWTLWIYQNI